MELSSTFLPQANRNKLLQFILGFTLLWPRHLSSQLRPQAPSSKGLLLVTSKHSQVLLCGKLYQEVPSCNSCSLLPGRHSRPVFPFCASLWLRLRTVQLIKHVYRSFEEVPLGITLSLGTLPVKSSDFIMTNILNKQKIYSSLVNENHFYSNLKKSNLPFVSNRKQWLTSRTRRFSVDSFCTFLKLLYPPRFTPLSCSRNLRKDDEMLI